MPKSLPPLTALRCFEAVSRLGGFARAARELHVTPAAVSHQIRGLEQYLGVTLFRRTTRKLALTEPAAAAAESLREAFERIGQGVERLRAGGHGGELAISATPAFATRWLVARLPRFQRLHPGIALRMATTPAPVDFEHDDVDVAIRLGRGAFDGAASVELFGEWIAPVATPAFLRAHRVRRPADLARVPLIHDDSLRRAGRPAGWREWCRIANGVPVDARSGTRFDDGHLALQAAAAGGGVALGRLVYAVDDLDAKRLRIALPPIVATDVTYRLLVPESRASRPAVMAFRHWIEGEARAFRRGIERTLGRAVPVSARSATRRRAVIQSSPSRR